MTDIERDPGEHDPAMQASAAAVAPEAAAPAPPEKLVLRILSGLHSGASRVLGEQEMLLIGNGEDCDIVLSDPGVARHHAMILRNGDSLALRTIDAPAGFAGDPLYPGDPIDLPLRQPVQLGDAALAVGSQDDPDWARLGPVAPGLEPAIVARPAWRPSLPTTLISLAVLSLVSVAIYASVKPARQAPPTTEQQLATLVTDYRIGDSATSTNAAGLTVLSGTVADSAACERIQQRIDAGKLPVQLNLRTGEDVAADVREVLRSQGITAQTRYLGNGDVEVSGRFEDQDKLRAAATSRAMIDVAGINRVIPRNYAAEREQREQPAVAQADLSRVVSVIGGADPYVLTSDGTRYPVGAELPGDRGTLVGIGKGAWALVDGQIREIKPEPATDTDGTAEAAAGNATGTRDADADAVAQAATGDDGAAATTRPVPVATNAGNATARSDTPGPRASPKAGPGKARM